MENAEKSASQNATPAAVCERVRSAVERAGITNIELSRRSGLSYRVIHSIMHGTTNPRMTTLAHIADAIGISLESLTGAPLSNAMAVREEGVSYGKPSALRELRTGWRERFIRCVDARSVLIEGAVKEYAMPFRDAIRPAVEAFEKEEENQ